MAMCNARIGHLSTRTGKEIVPTIAHSCELPQGHDGPHFSPMDRRSITERAQWDAGAKDRFLAQGPLAKLQGPMERTGAADPDTGVIPPNPDTHVPCPLCRTAVPYRDVMAHVTGHLNRSSAEVPEGLMDSIPAPEDPATGPSFPAPAPLTSEPPSTPSPSRAYGKALDDLLDWVVPLSDFVQVPAKVGEAIKVLRPPRKT